MAQLIVSAAGAAIGFAVGGPMGAKIGWVAGSMIGSTFAPTQKSAGPRLEDLTVSTSAYGTPIPYLAGSPRAAGQIVWASTKREIATTTEQGKGGGGGSEYTSYTYEVDLLYLLSDNEIVGVSRVWSNGELVYDGATSNNAWTSMTVYTGSATQLPDPTYEAVVGTASAPAYRGRGSVSIVGLQLGGSGQIPNLTFEIATSADSIAYSYGTCAYTLYPRAVNHYLYSVSALYGGDPETGEAIIFTSNADLYANGTYTVSSRSPGGSESTIGSFAHYSNPTNLNGPFNGVTLDGWSDEPLLPTCSTNTLRLHDQYGAFVKDITVPGMTTSTQSMQYFRRSIDGVVFEYVFIESASSVIYRVSGGAISAEFSSAARGNPHAMCLGENLNYVFSATQQLTAYSAGWSEAWNVDMSALPLGGVSYSIGGTDLVMVEEADGRVFASYGGYFYLVTSAGYEELCYSPDHGDVTGRTYERHGGNWLWNGIWFEIMTKTAPSYPQLGGVAEISFGRTTTSSPAWPAVTTVVAQLCELSGLSAEQYSVAELDPIETSVRAMAVSQVSSARTVLEMLAASYHFDCVLSDKLYFRPRASASVATLTFDEFGVAVDASSNTDPLPLMMANELEIPAQMAITFSNVDADYLTDTQYSDRLLTGQESTSTIALPLGFTASEGKQIADTLLLDKAVGALSTSVSVNITRADLEPTDVVTLTGDDGFLYRMRVMKKTEANGVITLGCVADDASVFTQTGSTDSTATAQTTVTATTATEFELLDIPLLRDVDNSPGFYLAVMGGEGWTHCAVFTSLDDLTYTQVTTLADQTAIGACTTTLGNWTGGNVFDETSTVTVNVGAIQQLASVTRAELLVSQSLNAALVGSELIQYRTATLVSPGVYTLSGLLRGRRGTEWASTGHAASELFVALGTTGMRYLTLQSGDLGSARYYKVASAGQRLSDVTAQTITPLGVPLECYSPVNARANRDTTDTVLTWTRRTRLSTRLTGALAINAPLGETTESYEVEVWDATYTTLIRTITAASETATYTSAQQVTDFGSDQAVLYLNIYQLSATVGRGYPLTVSI